MKKEILLRQTLFWDVDLKKLDTRKDAKFIIGRVLDFGDLKEWVAVRQLYGMEKITRAAKSHIFSDPRSANFWSLILSVPRNKLKCTRFPSLKLPNAFLRR